MVRHARRLVFSVLASASLVVACGGKAPPPSAPNDKLGERVGFSLPSDEGALVTVPLADTRVTVLDFFGPTCEPCREKVPALYAKRDELAKKGAKLVFVGVLADGETTDDAKRALASWGVQAPFLVDNAGTGKREAGVTALPATLVLDARGALTWAAPPTASADDVVAAVP